MIISDTIIGFYSIAYSLRRYLIFPNVLVCFQPKQVKIFKKLGKLERFVKTYLNRVLNKYFLDIYLKTKHRKFL